MERAELAHDGAGDVERDVRFSGDADGPVRGQREGNRHVVDAPVPGEHVIERGLSRGRRPAAPADIEAKPRVERGGTHPDVEEPRRAGPAAPEQGTLLRRGGEAVRGGRVLGVAGAPFGRVRRAGRVVEGGEVAAQVGQGSAVAAGGGPAALDYVRDHHHRAQRHEDQRRDVAGDRVEDAAQQDRGDHRQDREALAALRLRQLRAVECLAGVAGGDDRRAVERGCRGMRRGARLRGELDSQDGVAQPQPVARQP